MLRFSIVIIMLALTFCGRTSAQQTPDVFVEGHGYHGIHGLTFDDQDRLYVGSVVGQRIHRVDPQTGASEVWQAPPLGMADDLEFAPDGRLVWTSFLLGKIHARQGDGPVQELAGGLPGINSLAFRQDGRLFATQVFLGDALYEIDPQGAAPPRLILKDLGGLNGFDFGPDGLLYGPLWFRGQVVRIDVDKPEVHVVTDGLGVPAAVNFNSKGELYVLDTAAGQVIRVQPETGAKEVIATLRTGLDNLAFDSHDRMFVTGMAEGAIFQVDTNTGDVRVVKDGPLGVPTDLAIYGGGLYIADTFAVHRIDLDTRESTALVRLPQLDYAFGIDVTDRHVHTASWFNSVVQTFDRNTGEVLHTYDELPTAYDVLEDSDGSILVLQMFPGSITRITGDGEDDRELVARGLSGAVAMVRGGQDTVYVSLYGEGKIVRVDLLTGENETVAEGLENPEGLAVAPDGRILVVETGPQRVSVIDPKSGARSVLAHGLSLSMQLPPALPPMGSTSGVAVTDAGDVYLSSEKDVQILHLKLK